MKKPAETKAGSASKPFSIRLAPAIRAALSKAGKLEDRPAACVALRYIVEGLKSAGFLK